MVILKVGLLREPPVLCTSGKTYQLSSFSFKNFTLYIYSPVHTRKTSRTSPRISEPHCDSDLVSRLRTSSLALNIALLDFALPRSLSLSHGLTLLSHAFAHSLLYPGHSDLNYIIIGTPIRSYDLISQLCLRTNLMSTDLQYAYTLSRPHDYLPRSSFPTLEMNSFLPGYYLPSSHFMFPQTFTNTRSSDFPELRHIPVLYKP